MFVFMRDGKNGKSTNGNGHKKSEKKKDKKGKKKN